MNPARTLNGPHVNDVEIIERVEAMLDERRPIPVYLRAVAAVVRKKRQEIENNRALGKSNVDRWARSGHPDLIRYSRHKSGLHLFRAYLKQRDHVRPVMEERKANAESVAKASRPFEWYTTEIAELTMLAILDELDPVIGDLLRVCEDSSAIDPATALRRLRHALRIGRGNSRHDAHLETTQRAAIYLWWQAVNKKDHRSLSAIAGDIANQLSISKRTALNHLKQGQREHGGLGPALAEARKSAQPVATKERLRSPVNNERKPRRRGRLSFGKIKRANK